MANSAEANLPIVNAVNELKDSNKDQRERLQKSMRAGLLNIRKSVDALSLSFERSLIDQNTSQKRMHETTMQFQEDSLEQGKHSGHLFAAKMTAVGAGLVAFFEKKLLGEFKNVTKAVKEGKVIQLRSEEEGADKSNNRLLEEILEVLGGGDNDNNIRNTLNEIRNNILTHPEIHDAAAAEKAALEKRISELTGEQKRFYEIMKKSRETDYIVSAENQQKELEKKRDEEKEELESKKEENTKDVKEGLGWWQKIFKGIAGLGAGIFIYDNWDKIKDGLVGIKNFIHGTYKFVANNWDTVKLILEGSALLYAGYWGIKGAVLGWKALVLTTSTTITTIKTTSAKIAARYTAAKGQLLVALAAITPWLLPIAGIAWAGNALLDAFDAADEELERSGSKWEAVKAGTAQFHESLITGPLDLVKNMTSWVADLFGFPDIAKKLDEYDVKTQIYDKMKETVSYLIKELFDYLKESYESIKDWLFPDPSEIKQSVMEDPNVKPFETMTPGMVQKIEDEANSKGFLFQKDKDVYDAVMRQVKGQESSNTPSGNGAGEQIINGAVDGVPVSQTINNVTPVNTNNVQNSTINKTTITAPINTRPTSPVVYEGQMINGLLVPY